MQISYYYQHYFCNKFMMENFKIDGVWLNFLCMYKIKIHFSDLDEFNPLNDIFVFM